MIASIVSLLLDLSHCARWQATPRGPACADVRLDAPGCLVTGWHEFGRQRINVCVRQCGAEGPTS
jgi:hypothetical protein